MTSLTVLGEDELRPVRAAHVPAAARATREALQHLRQAPARQVWDVDGMGAA